MDVEFIRKDHDLLDLQMLGLPADPRPARDPLRVLIFGHQLGPFPHPTQFMKPAPHRPRRHLKTMFGVEFEGQRGRTPARATPPIRPGWGLQQGDQRAFHPRHQDSGAHGGGQWAVLVHGKAQLLGVI